MTEAKEKKGKSNYLNLGLAPGAGLMLEFEGRAGQMKSFLVGEQQGVCIIVRLPMEPGIESFAQTNSLVTVRYLDQGSIFGFHSVVLSRFVKGPLRFLFIEPPKNLESVDLRKTPRVTCNFLAKLLWKDMELAGTIQDVSPNGARYICKAPQGRGEPIPNKDEEVALNGYVLGAKDKMEIKCLVRSCLRHGGHLVMGLQFSGGQAEVTEAIGAYVDKVVSILEGNGDEQQD